MSCTESGSFFMQFWIGTSCRCTDRELHFFMASKQKILFARELRKNPTMYEEIVWSYLKKKQTGFRFIRQHPICGFIVDFYCPNKKLAVEIDGDSHIGKEKYDQWRQKIIEHTGVKVIRYTNKEIKECLTGSIVDIEMHLIGNVI